LNNMTYTQRRMSPEPKYYRQVFLQAVAVLMVKTEHKCFKISNI